MRYKTLIARRDEATGEVGLCFEELMVSPDLPSAAQEGLQIAHDLFEHVNGISRIGTIHDEMEALGGIWFVRGELNDLSRTGRGSSRSPYEHLASDFTRLFLEQSYVSFLPCRVKTKEHPQDPNFETIIDIARRDLPKEYDSEVFAEYDIDEYFRSALHYMRIGYRKCGRRYGTRFDGQAKANDMFWGVAEAVDKIIKNVEVGQRFRLGWNWSEAVCNEIYED